MIVERCKDLMTKFSVAHHTYQLQTRLSRVQQEAERVKTLRQQAQAAAAILTTLSLTTTDPTITARIDEAARMAEAYPRLASLWKQLKSDQNLLGGRDFEAYKVAYYATANTCNSLRGAAERTWRDYASSCIPNDDPILEVFRGSNPEIVADLRRLGRELLTLHDITSPSRAEIEQFERKVAVYRTALQSLGGDIPENVRKALQATAAGSASLDLFPSDVVAWLRNRGVAGSFRVIAKSTS